MSPKRRRRARPARPGERTETALMPGVCAAPDVEAMMQQTHDQLIDTAGVRRRSGIGWRIYKHGDEPRRTFEDLFSDSPAQDALTDFRRVFDELGDQAVLVVANCQVAR